MITLKMLVRENQADVDAGEGEDDGIGTQQYNQESTPVALSTAKIRNVHARKYGKPGTRIVFENGSALIVVDSYAEVVQAWRADLGELSAEDPA